MKKQRYKIGIDIGGTNTDVVLVNSETKIAAYTKVATTHEVNDGIRTGLKQIMQDTKIKGEEISGIFLGTTQAVNAIHQRHNLSRVGVIRIAGHHPQSLPSCFSWPKDLRDTLYVGTETVDGGFECHGDLITPINPPQIRKAVENLQKQKMESLAIVGVFASLNPCHELLAKEISQEVTKGKIPISLSHQIGGAGFIERENSTILNAALKSVMSNVFKNLVATCSDLGIACPIWVTQNNGSILDLAHAIEYPVLTISAGPTNSFIGGARLAQLEDAIVIDIGGTSTDIGVIRRGIPRQCLNNSKIGGISLNFSIPDVCSIALGGGSQVRIERNKFELDSKSCGNRTFIESVSFGGKQLTLTDIALALGHLEIPGARPKNVTLSHRGCKLVMDEALRKIYDLISTISPEERSLPIVMIGGGASLLPKNLLGGRCVIPPYANVANAFGAALAEISATVDTVVSLSEREKTLEALRQQAIQLAIQKGADFKTIKVVDLEILPYPYIPNQLARVIVRASGSQSAF
ncbi:hydantoinase/oxoprolinase family protein [Parachlamydia sp. AcF125]|uniref:hydantoinase/oxoprolinase N-terminal domain-containing protein n=1 Tax=Parachlamydia sp. AcF125 TaxID=2795736 RepID=UPI001BC8FC52|nr:hydantoinase/oxoprolinase family protein [Parachlamydia sp. AcF125]MBS4167676.1 Acetophenone carboxylase gamma subunit [Parachlamydia sp. AcF125]